MTEALVAVAATAGAVQLFTGTFTPPVSAIEPLGLESWRLPALWLFASVAVPAAIAAWSVWRDVRWARLSVIVASAALGVELVVQIPFVGPSVLQAVMGAVAIVCAAVAWWGGGYGSGDAPSRRSDRARPDVRRRMHG